MVSKVYMVGMGMGNPRLLTSEAREALDKSELVVGSQRLLDALGDMRVRKVALVRTAQIAKELRAAPERVACVVMSGDIGFYSGATPLYSELAGMEVTTIPGISSLAYLCARLRCPWQDAYVVSSHGRDHDAVGDIQSHAKTFVLLGGSTTASGICRDLCDRGLGKVRVSVGENLSYKDERIVVGTAEELADKEFNKLSVLLAENDAPLVSSGAPHLHDEAFHRGNVPMTKEEVRALAVCKLRMGARDVVWDVGAGTGSVSVELARAAYAGQVFAVEKNPEAVALIEQNKESLGATNLRVVTGEAPHALKDLPKPDRVFVGGSSGEVQAILDAAFTANPKARACVVAITLETLAQVLDYVQRLNRKDVDFVQLSVAKARELGAYHLMQANNPVYLITVG